VDVEGRDIDPVRSRAAQRVVDRAGYVASLDLYLPWRMAGLRQGDDAKVSG
jgi:hypothetical protein